MSQSLEQELYSPEAHVTYGSLRVPVIKFNCFEQLSWLAHGFSTRLGGVSRGDFESMNLSFTRGDVYEDVRENFRRFGEAAKIPCESMVFTHQTHTVHVRAVTEKDRGKGICVPRDFENTDGLITDRPGVALVTFFADCIPLFFADTRRRVIGASHSGWRGTVGKIGLKTVQAMQEHYGCVPESLTAVIGPGICRHCYEVGAEVADAVRAAFPKENWDMLLTPKKSGEETKGSSEGDSKYMLDLWAANVLVLLEAGLLRENIHVSGLCTHCHPQALWSHRSLGNARGSLAGFIMLKPEE